MENEIKIYKDIEIQPAPSIKIASYEEEAAILKALNPKINWSTDLLRERRKNSAVFLIEYGSKTLLLYFVNKKDFLTVIANTGKEKIPEDTTIVYMEAKKTMQQEVDKLKTTANYVLETTNEKLVGWANSKGQTLFQWNKIEKPTGTNLFWKFQTKIKCSDTQI